MHKRNNYKTTLLLVLLAVLMSYVYWVIDGLYVYQMQQKCAADAFLNSIPAHSYFSRVIVTVISLLSAFFISFFYRKNIKMRHSLINTVEQYQTTLSAVNDGLFDYNVLEDKVFYSENYYTMLGYVPNEFPHLNAEWEKRLHPDDKDRVINIVNKHISRGDKFEVEYRMLCKDGTYLWVMGRGKAVQKDEDGKPLRVVGTHTDISKSKGTETRLAFQQQMFLKLVENIHLGVALQTVSGDNKFLFWNERLEKITEIQAVKALSKNLEQIAINKSLKQLINETQQLAIENRKVFQISDAELVMKDGEVKILLITVIPIFNEFGKVDHLFMLFSDVTENKMVERQIHYSQKMESLGVFAGSVAHDFNNMLTAVSGSAEMIEKIAGENEKVLKYVNTIKKMVDSGVETTQKLTSFSKSGYMHNELLDIHLVIKESAQMIGNKFRDRVLIDLHLDAENSEVLGSHVVLENVFISLALNSVEAFEDTGIILITTENTDSCPMDEEGGKNFVLITFSDNGPGIDPKHKSRLFDPFFTTKNVGDGTGLGLPVVYTSIVKHGGFIDISSKIGSGTSFSIYLPIAKKKSVQ